MHAWMKNRSGGSLVPPRYDEVFFNGLEWLAAGSLEKDGHQL
jgi:hypothetical protein